MADDATVRQAVRAHKAWGAAAMKVWYIMPPQPPDTARVSALVAAAGDETRKVGLPLIVHATGLWEAKDALRAGARVLVHSGWSAPVDDEFLALARRAGTIYAPTLMVPDGYRQVAARRFERDRQPLECVDPGTRAKALATDSVAPAKRPTTAALEQRAARTAQGLAQGLANLKRVRDAGIPIALGTDAGNPLTLHGASVFMELEAMQASGLTPRDVRSEEHTSELQSQSNLVCRIIRSEEHTSELQSQSNLVCRLLLEKKKHWPRPRSSRDSFARRRRYSRARTTTARSTGATPAAQR